MKRKTLLLLTFTILLGKVGFGCSCISVNIDSAFHDSSLIFKGKVKEIIKDKYYNYQGFNVEIINFEVLKGFKIAKPEKGIVSLINYNSSCDFFFEEGKEYYVFAYDLGYGHYSTSICTKTANVINFKKTDLERLTELSNKWEDDLFNYKSLTVIDKTTLNALHNENESLKAKLEENRDRLNLLIYLISGIALILLGYIFYLRTKK